MGLAAGGQVLLPADRRWGGGPHCRAGGDGTSLPPCPILSEHSWGGGCLNSPELCATTSSSLGVSGAKGSPRPSSLVSPAGQLCAHSLSDLVRTQPTQTHAPETKSTL